MALIIRLRQQGKNNRRSFRLVVTNVRSPRDGKFIENLGFYDPLATDDKAIAINEERIAYWLDKGALISDQAKSIVGKKVPALIKKLTEKKVAKKVKEAKKRKAKKVISKPKVKKPAVKK
jgi:small subunit ribosomal protein S16